MERQGFVVRLVRDLVIFTAVVVAQPVLALARRLSRRRGR